MTDLTIDYIKERDELLKKIERLRERLRNPTPEMLEAGRAANRLMAGNALGLDYIAPDASWKAMADVLLKEGE